MIYAYKDGRFIRGFDTLRECAKFLEADVTACSKHLSRDKYRQHIQGYILYKEQPTAEQAMIDSVRVRTGLDLSPKRMIQIYQILNP